MVRYGGMGDNILMIFVYTILSLILLVILIPIINVIASSLSSPKAVSQGRVSLWPIDFTFVGYTTVLRSPMIKIGFTNSIINTVCGTAYSVILTILAAYPLSRRDLYGRGFFMFLFTLTMFIGGGLIPSYLLVSRLGLINTRWAVIIPGAVGVWNVIVTRTFFQINIPEELLQAAQIDGCDDFRFVWNVVLALSKPIIAVQILLYAVGQWNSYFSALLYINKVELMPLQIVLRNILQLTQMTADMTPDRLMAYMAAEDARYISYAIKYSLIIIASLPIMILYPFIQKYFIKGVLIGSLKG